MPRAVWTGSISFGLVNIGVRLFPATSPKDVRFHLVDDKGRRVRFRRFVPEDVAESDRPRLEGAEEVTAERARGSGAPTAAEREMGYEDLRRGYETDEGTIVLDQAEIESARPSRSRTIDIEDFVELADVDPVYFEKSYVLVPQRDAEKPYALLLRAMERAGHVGIGRFVLRTKPHLAAIRPAEGVLGLETMFFADEVRDGRELAPGIDEIAVSDRELQLAQTLIDTLKTDWDPTRYADTYREELLRRLAEKTPIYAEAEATPTSRTTGGGVEELLEAVKASVEEAKKAKKRSA